MKKRSIVQKVFREKTIERFNIKIKLLGINCTYNSIDLLNARLIIELSLFFLILIFSDKGFIVAPTATVVFHYLGEYFVLDVPIKKRRRILEQEALYFFEVLVLTLESGRNLKSALENTCHNIDNDMSLEFKKSLEEVELGKSLVEALESMKKRIPSDTINNAILNITQSNIFGNSIIESLYSQIDFLREKHLLEIKKEISKLPTKISILSVIFFIPIMLLIILAPVILNYLFG